ncbi:DUF1707 SHOCT-like domain-containing protein [Actinomycetospora sp. NBC_00405]|uniref:DUF1707 SHOCT-like domain-containing protein n=1 Tax=Actinomycetospora sp. NBC_00405 TaxID=2975952 RepID=UPI002E1B3336
MVVVAGELRVADADRERVAARLGEAHAEGRLTLAEYDERVRAAHGAVVGSDLLPLTADLPAEAPVRSGGAVRPGAPSPIRAAVAVWAVVSVINLVIWVAVSVGTGGVVAPWWIWVAGPWGVALAIGAVAGRAGLPFPGGCAGMPIRR